MNAAVIPIPPRGYHTRLADLDRDREAIIALWQRNLADAVHRAAKFDWFYRDCPYGPSMLVLLYHDDALIGCSGVAPRRMQWRGAALRAGLLADIAVDAEHRTLGPALMLQEALIAAAASRFDLLYGFPNRKSVPVAMRIGYAVIGELTRYSLVLRYAGYLHRYLPRWLAAPAGAVLDGARATWLAWRRPHAEIATTWTDQVDARMDALWQHPVPDATPIAVRDGPANHWRFDRCPRGETRYLLLADRPDAPLRAWFACQVRGNVLCVADYWADRASAHTDLDIAATLVQAARRSGYSSISFAHSGCAAVMDGWQHVGFVAREGRPVIAKWLGIDPADMSPDRPWFITQGDEDE